MSEFVEGYETLAKVGPRVSIFGSARTKRRSKYYRLAERRYRIGVDSNLTFLDAQRQLFSAQQSLITDRLAQLTSEVNLYKALGGGWNEQTAKNEPLKEEAPAFKAF
jgi:multidrug efflux system outer membrane protein